VRILIVDDNRDLADGLAELLELHGHEVDVAATGASGVEAARDNSYDAALVDVRLPDIDGVELVERIVEFAAATRIMLMTGYSAPDVLARADELPGVELLIKPLDPMKLLEWIG
jgi:DNA-binding response OmpR family regulator